MRELLMDILGRAWVSTKRPQSLPASFVPVLRLDSPEGLGPVALNPQRRRHLDHTSTNPPLPLFPGSGSSERAVASAEGGTHTERPPMKMRGGTFLSVLSARFPRARALLSEAGPRPEARKSSSCWQNGRAGARVQVLLSAFSVSTACRVLARRSVTGTTRAQGRLDASASPFLPRPSQSRPASRSSYRPSSLPWSLSKGLPLVTPR